MLPPPPTSRQRLLARLHAVTQYDVFPEFSARVRRLVYNPLGVLLLAAATALLCGFFLHPQGFVLAGGIAVVLALGIAWPWLQLRGVLATLAFDRSRASEGDAVEVRLTVRNRSPWGARGLAVRRGISDPRDPDAPVAGIASAPRRRSAICRWAFTPGQRGVYPTESPRLTTGFPFGLWHSSRTIAVVAPLIVWPRTLPVGPVPAATGGSAEGSVSRNKVGSDGDVLGVRPYRRGDSPRRIHWAQSARHDRLIVCELQANTRPVIQLVLDADPSVHVGTGSDGSREWAIRVVASFARGWLAEGARVGATWNEMTIPPASGVAQLHRILDALAALPNTPGKPLDWVLANHTRRDGLQMIVTTDRSFSQQRAEVTEQQRWVVLRSAGFGPCESRPVAVRPWLWIEDRVQLATQLLCGWREARHGS